MKKKRIAIIDYGINNISSFVKAFNKIDVQTETITKFKELKNFQHVVLPGVGSFDSGVKNLTKLGFYDEIKEINEKGKYILGICLGMQLLFQKSEESYDDMQGLSLLEGVSKKLKLDEKNYIKVPHVGWNTLNIEKKNILKNLDNKISFYFIHSYYIEPKNPEIISATCVHGHEFPAVVENKNVVGIQFHPEKCQTNGLKILKNFTELN